MPDVKNRQRCACVLFFELQFLMLPGLFYQINHAHATCIWYLAADATKCCVTTPLTTTVDPDRQEQHDLDMGDPPLPWPNSF